jgi:hypothetical protein
MTIFQTKLKNLILTLVVGILITGNVCADSASPKKPSQPQNNTPPTTDFTRQRPRLERSKQDTITLPASKSNKPSVSITEDVTPKPVPLPAKPNIPPVAKPVDPPVAIPEITKPKPVPLPAKPNIPPVAKPDDPPVAIPEITKPKPVPLPAKPNIPPVAKPVDPPVAIPEITKPKPVPLPAKPNIPPVAKPVDPPVAIPEITKPKPVPLPTKPNTPPVAKPVDPPVAIPRPLPVPKPPMVPQPSRPTPRLPVQEPVLNLINPIGPDRRNQPLDRNFYVQQTVRDYHTHVHKYPVPFYRNQGFVNYPSTYSWINNNRYYYGCYYRNYNYITCYDWFNRRFSIIAMPVQNPVYPIVSTYTPVAYCQSLDTNGFLGPMLMLLRIAQGNYSCLTLIN